MPLISELCLRGHEHEEDHIEKFHDTLQVQHQKENTKEERVEGNDSGYEDIDEGDECLDSDMEGSVINRPRPKKAKMLAVPALPQRSEKRTSTILDNVLKELQNLDGSSEKDMKRRSVIEEEDPHELYLSSEEDASLSDDYDQELADENEESSPTVGEKRSSSRISSNSSHEDTARIVKFVTVGRSQVVEIFIHYPSSRKRQSLDLKTINSSLTKSPAMSSRPRPTPRRPSPLKLFPDTPRPVSVSSVGTDTTVSTVLSPSNTLSHQTSRTTAELPTYSTSYVPLRSPLHSPSKSMSDALPPRKSSRLASNLSTFVSSTKTTIQATIAASSAPQAVSQPSSQNTPSHSFLSMDPFEASQYPSSAATSPRHSIQSTSNYAASLPPEPKTPTGGWKMSRSISRTLSKARKSSMPRINLAYTSGVTNVGNSNNDSKVTPALASSPAEEALTMNETEREKENPSALSRRSATMPSLMTKEQAELAQKNKLRHENMMRNAMKVASESRKGMMSLGRKKSSKTADQS